MTGKMYPEMDGDESYERLVELSLRNMGDKLLTVATCQRNQVYATLAVADRLDRLCGILERSREGERCYTRRSHAIMVC